jgi:type II secretory pathway pseudopilin PulG
MKTPTMNSKQTGATLMEVLVAMSISLVVTAAMIAMMANSLGTTARIIKMTKLTDDMRVALQMMTRDVRRSNYNADSMLCYANDNCASDGAITSAGEINISANNDCFWFLTDREHDNYESDIAAGAFRRVEVDLDGDGSSVGVLEMWTGSGTPPSTICDPDIQNDDWVEITNPDNMDISEFSVVDNETGPGLSYTQVIQTDADGNPTLSQTVRKMRMNIRGQLVMDNTIDREMEDTITVRNDLLL